MIILHITVVKKIFNGCVTPQLCGIKNMMEERGDICFGI